MYPFVEINLKKIASNATTMVEICKNYNIEITAISKMFLGDKRICTSLIKAGINKIGDSRIENLKKIKDLPVEKWLIRLPMISQVDEVIKYSDVSLNSEISTIKKLNYAASKVNKIHKIILMVDLGDLREGYYNYNEIYSVVSDISRLKYIKLYGIGTNLSCLSFVQPDEEKLNLLSSIAKNIEKILSTNLEIISGGNSSTINLLLNSKINKNVNNLRLGESIIFGRERETYKYISNTFSDTFILKTEIIEIKDKPSMPWGKIGKDSYGISHTFIDKGIRKRAICAIGKQDIDIDTIEALDTNIEIVGSSGDHLIIDITNCSKNYIIGDVISFKLFYPSALKAMTSEFVRKKYIV